MGNRYQRLWRGVMILIFLWSVFHFVRDLLQILGVHNILTEIATRDHRWCRVVVIDCNFVSFPPAIFNIIVIPIVLKRRKIGLLGVSVFLSVFSIIFMWLLP